jgi:hypothetical protein
MRVLAIAGALLIGLAGVFMSVCGGGFFVVLAYESVKAIFRAGQQNQKFGASVLLLIQALGRYDVTNARAALDRSGSAGFKAPWR